MASTVVITYDGPPVVTLRLTIKGKWLERACSRSLYGPFEARLGKDCGASVREALESETGTLFGSEGAVPRDGTTRAWVSGPGTVVLEYKLEEPWKRPTRLDRKASAPETQEGLRVVLARALRSGKEVYAREALACGRECLWSPPPAAARVDGSLLQRASRTEWPRSRSRSDRACKGLDAGGQAPWTTPFVEADGFLACGSLEKREGVAIRECDFVDPKRWSTSFLADELGTAPVVVLESPGESDTYLHYVDSFLDRAQGGFCTTRRSTCERRMPVLDRVAKG